MVNLHLNCTHPLLVNTSRYHQTHGMVPLSTCVTASHLHTKMKCHLKFGITTAVVMCWLQQYYIMNIHLHLAHTHFHCVLVNTTQTRHTAWYRLLSMCVAASHVTKFDMASHFVDIPIMTCWRWYMWTVVPCEVSKYPVFINMLLQWVCARCKFTI